ncbi:MAG: inositol monophosphatase [Vicinamibacterales bacterium]
MTKGQRKLLPSIPVDAVTALLVEVGRNLILPRFRHLRPDEIERKHTLTDPDDIVTAVDRQAEEHLTKELLSLVPGTAVIGEEAVHSEPAILGSLASDDPVWLLDPIDGTRNFASGDDGFGIMLAYVAHGETLAAWVVLPARDEIYVAEAGSGARRNGQAMRVPTPEGRIARGAIHPRYMPVETRLSAERQATGRFQRCPDTRSAAVEYTQILAGTREFAVYYRLLPWDHAAPALLLVEGGGVVVHLDGRPYTPRSADQVTVVAGSVAVASMVSGWFVDVGRGAE